MRDDCPNCNPPIGVICPTHCAGRACRDGEHVDRCVGPGRLPLAAAYARSGFSAGVVDQIAKSERAFNDMIRSL